MRKETKKHSAKKNLPSIAFPGLDTKKSLVYWLVIFVFIGCIIFLPWHMDQYVMFHRLACENPAQALNTFREYCPGPYTKLGDFILYRSYSYIGAASSIIQAPLQLIYDRLITVQLAGLIFLILSLLAIKKSFFLPIWSVAIMLLYFPLSYSLIQDGGPVRLTFLAIGITPYLLYKAYYQRVKIKSFLSIFLMYGLWFASVEDKPFFMYLLPGLFFFSLACFPLHSETSYFRIWDIKKYAIFQALVFVIFGSSCVMIMALLQDGSGSSYLSFIRDNKPSISYQEHTSRLLTGLRFIFDWSFNANRIIYTDQRNPLLVLIGFIFTSLLTIFPFIYITRMTQKSYSFMALMLYTSSMLFYLFAWLPGGNFHHHYFFSVLPLSILFCLFLKKAIPKHASIWINILAIASLSSLITVTMTPNWWYSSNQSRPIIDRVLEQANDKAIVNCATWGCYFSTSFSEHREVPIVWAEKQSHIDRLLEYAKSNNKNIFHICTSCDEGSVASNYKNTFIKSIDSENDWRVFSIKPLK